MIRNWQFAGLLGTGWLWTNSAFADVLPVLAQIKVTQTGGKTYILEAIVTVALFGAALFAVCRTSRRS